MRKGYRRKYNWNLFGKQCGTDIIGRLKWINGKPMVNVFKLNVFLLISNIVFAKIPEMDVLTSHWGWGLFNMLAIIAFWVLFVDGVIVRFLWSFTRGAYCRPYVFMVRKFSKEYVDKKIKEDLAWAWFLFTHPEFDYRLQEIENRYTVGKAIAGEKADPRGYNLEVKALMKEFSVKKDDKGRYFSWNDKKYRRLLEKM